MARILYLCPGVHQKPYGGMRRLYRHVDVLSDLGFDAHIVHARPGHRLNWFPNNTPVMAAPIRLHRDDILVIPEVYKDKTSSIGPGLRRVSINLNVFNWLPSADDHSQVDAIITNSEYSLSVLRQLNAGAPFT